MTKYLKDCCIEGLCKSDFAVGQTRLLEKLGLMNTPMCQLSVVYNPAPNKDVYRLRICGRYGGRWEWYDELVTDLQKVCTLITTAHVTEEDCENFLTKDYILGTFTSTVKLDVATFKELEAGMPTK